MKFVLLSDLHFVPRGAALYGMRPQDRFEPCIELINRTHAEADFILIAGDLAHKGEAGAYLSVSQSISRFDKPVHLMVGNHDSRSRFLDMFPQARRDAGGFIQFVIEDEAHRLICVDTLHEGGSEGRMCEARLDWLAEALRKPRVGRHLTIVMHHPPFDLGIPTMDLIRMRDDRQFRAVLERFGWPDQFIFGHVHRPVNGVWHGVPFHIQRGINHQVSLNFGERNWIEGTDEGPDYAFVVAEAGKFLIFTRSFGEARRRFDLSPVEAARTPGDISGQS